MLLLLEYGAEWEGNLICSTGSVAARNAAASCVVPLLKSFYFNLGTEQIENLIHKILLAALQLVGIFIVKYIHSSAWGIYMRFRIFYLYL